MTEPATPAPVKPSWAARIRAMIVWARSPNGRKDIGAAVAVVTAIYTALHRAGL